MKIFIIILLFLSNITLARLSDLNSDDDIQRNDDEKLIIDNELNQLLIQQIKNNDLQELIIFFSDTPLEFGSIGLKREILRVIRDKLVKCLYYKKTFYLWTGACATTATIAGLAHEDNAESIINIISNVRKYAITFTDKFGIKPFVTDAFCIGIILGHVICYKIFNMRCDELENLMHLVRLIHVAKSNKR